MTDSPVPPPAGEDPTYPLTRPDNDPLFTFALATDVAGVLTRHGYPPLTGGADLVRLQEHLFRFLYTHSADLIDRGEHRTRMVLTGGGVYELRCSCGWQNRAMSSREAEESAAMHRLHPRA